MKKKITVLMLSALMMINFTGCKKQGEPAIKPENTKQETKVDYALKYKDILANVYTFIQNINSETEPDEGYDGIWEAAKALGDDALDEIGYVLKDISGDDIPELLIGAFEKDDDAYTNNEI